MANKYFSNERTFNARNLIKLDLSPPADLVVTPSDINLGFMRLGQYGGTGMPVNAAGNVFVKTAGLFCNFADGLVFKDPNASFNITLQFYGKKLSGTALTGVITMTIGSDTLAGTPPGLGQTSFLSELSAGDFILSPAGNMYVVKSVNSNISATIYNAFYESVIFPTGQIQKLTGVPGGAILEYQIRDLRLLNSFFKAEKFIPVATISSGPIPYLVCEAIVTLNDTALTFQTITIDPTFAGSATAAFDVMMEMEFTPIPIES